MDPATSRFHLLDTDATLDIKKRKAGWRVENGEWLLGKRMGSW